MTAVRPPVQHPAPWLIVLEGEGATVSDANGALVVAIPHQREDRIALWHRIVDAINAHEVRQ